MAGKECPSQEFRERAMQALGQGQADPLAAAATAAAAAAGGISESSPSPVGMAVTTPPAGTGGKLSKASGRGGVKAGNKEEKAEGKKSAGKRARGELGAAGEGGKKSKKKERLKEESKEEDEEEEEAIQQWIQCAKCDKWRRLQCDQATVDALSDDWECGEPPAKPALGMPSCEVPEDEVDSEETDAGDRDSDEEGGDEAADEGKTEWAKFGTDVVRYLMVSYNQEDIASAAGLTSAGVISAWLNGKVGQFSKPNFNKTGRKMWKWASSVARDRLQEAATSRGSLSSAGGSSRRDMAAQLGVEESSLNLWLEEGACGNKESLQGEPELRGAIKRVVDWLGDLTCPTCNKHTLRLGNSGVGPGVRSQMNAFRSHLQTCRGPMLSLSETEEGEWSTDGLGLIKVYTPRHPSVSSSLHPPTRHTHHPPT